jgi:predicted esterase
MSSIHGPGCHRFPAPVARIALGFLALAALAQPVDAQVERFELGQRLRRFEVAWQEASPEKRPAAVGPMNRAVRSFFGLQLRAAAAELDEAWFAVRPEGPAEGMEKAVIARHLVITPLVSETGGGPVRVVWAPFYGERKPEEGEKEEGDEEKERAASAGGSVPGDAGLRLTIELMGTDGKPLAVRELTAAEAGSGVEWDLSAVPAGDWRLVARAEFAGRTVTLPCRLHSRVESFAERVVRLEKGRAEARDRLDATARATLGEYIATFQSLLNGTTPEADFPVADWLHRSEAMLAATDNSMAWIGPAAKEGDVWLALAKGRKKTAVRLRAPANSADPLPVLFLFHGAGGSENMFFETYGAGAAVAEGLKRGWLVVAPRQGLMGLGLDCNGMLDVLEQHFTIDRTRVMVLGHSMGAGQVMRQVASRPELFRAAAAVGGGGRSGSVENLAKIPWLVAAGQFDFGRGGAAALARSLETAGAEVKYHELPDVEHMLIVQAALPLIFGFFDAQIR